MAIHPRLHLGTSSALRTDPALEALEQAIGSRSATEGLVHHSGRGGQDQSIRYTERLAEAAMEPSVGNVGDSYDNALAESVIGLFKTEVTRRRGPWRGPEDVAFATLDWVSWYNTQRPLKPIGYVPPSTRTRTIGTTRLTPWWRESPKQVSPGHSGRFMLLPAVRAC